MARVSRILGRIVLGLLILIVLLVGVVYALSARALGETYPDPGTTLRVSTDSATVARGEHLFQAVLSCVVCHGEDAGGKVFAEMGPIGTGVGANLTRGAGGVGAEYTAQDYVRAIRHGIRKDSTSLLIMPSEIYANLSDSDLGAVVAYVQQLPPVDRTVPRTSLKPLGRALLAFGALPMLAAPKVERKPPAAPVAPDSTAAYGAYLAGVGGCTGCHGADLSGGEPVGPPGSPAPPNLTPAGIGDWTQADFFRAIREGKRPDGRTLNEMMPWKEYGKMTDLELTAIWRYLHSVPERPTVR
jgi:mono/diheme cytochrome c family protein